MKGLFLPKCALLGCMLMWSNPISEFSAGPGTGFSGLGSWLLAEIGGGGCCHWPSHPVPGRNTAVEAEGQQGARGSVSRSESRGDAEALQAWLWHEEPHVGPPCASTAERQSAQKKRFTCHILRTCGVHRALGQGAVLCGLQGIRGAGCPDLANTNTSCPVNTFFL